MSATPRRPAIAGAAQFTQRVDDPREAMGPLHMMERALRDAAEDAGNPKLLEAIDAIYIPQGQWKQGDPGSWLAERVGAGSVATGMGILSGHICQVMVDEACREIAEGKRDVIAIVGGEAEHSQRARAKAGITDEWPEDAPGEADRQFGSHDFQEMIEEYMAGLANPILAFSICDTALRAHHGETPAAHRQRIAELESRFSAVAAENPNAWIQRHVPAEEILTPTPQNRMVSYPYTKLMTSNLVVDQSAALILCSEEAAARFGIASDRLVHLRNATEMSKDVGMMGRPALHEHRGMQIAAERLVSDAKIDASSVQHIDLYSCFPFAIQSGAIALGLDQTRPLTVTGGLTFSGGPFGNYVLQAMARMVERLREDSGSLGLIGSVGGIFAKFSFGLYSTDPGDAAAPHISDVSDEFAALPRRESDFHYDGAVTVEAYGLEVGRDGPGEPLVFALAADGTRTLARCQDPAVAQAILADEDLAGRAASVRDGVITLS